MQGFIGPAFLAFFVVEFVLIMQFMWRVIDDILGKGYLMTDYLELLSYFFVVLIPMSLPLTVLLASVMVYGDMAEKYELGSIKSSGVSLLRILMPGVTIALVIAIFSVISSNTLKPRAYKGYIEKYRSMKTNKLTFVFDEKVFNTDFKNYAIRIDTKESDGRTIGGILIYDQSDIDKSVYNVIRAQKGRMYTSPDAKYLIMDLEDGYHFKELREDLSESQRKSFKQQGRPVIRNTFRFMRKIFDLEALMDLSMTHSNYKAYETMTSTELLATIDSIDTQIRRQAEENLYPYTFFKKDDNDLEDIPHDIPIQSPSTTPTDYPTSSTQAVAPKGVLPVPVKPFVSDKYTLHPEKISDTTAALLEAITIRSANEYFRQSKKNIESRISKNSNSIYEKRRLDRDTEINRYALHKIYSWALVCIIFLFVGAPSGALVRKGGFGYPMLIAIGFYLCFIMSTIIGEKLTRSGSLQGWQGAWLPCAILLPFAIYLTWRALNDKQLLLGRISIPMFWGKEVRRS